MIPKTIHYCWFGRGDKPEVVKKCMATWKTHLSDYTFIEWNEENSDIDECAFAKKALQKKKWAFVSDYVRLSVLYKQGGIYLDTDMFVLKDFDELLIHDCFLGRQHNQQVNGCVIGSKPAHPFIERCITEYKHLVFDEYRLMNIAIPYIITNVFDQYILNKANEKVEMYPPSYFYPFAYEDSLTGKKFYDYIKPDTYAVHLWNTSWFSKKEIAGFALHEKKYGKALSLMFQYIVNNPRYLLRLPSMLYRYTKKRLSD